jgi:hypothetical protein
LRRSLRRARAGLGSPVLLLPRDAAARAGLVAERPADLPYVGHGGSGGGQREAVERCCRGLVSHANHWQYHLLLLRLVQLPPLMLSGKNQQITSATRDLRIA